MAVSPERATETTNHPPSRSKIPESDSVVLPAARVKCRHLSVENHVTPKRRTSDAIKDVRDAMVTVPSKRAR